MNEDKNETISENEITDEAVTMTDENSQGDNAASEKNSGKKITSFLNDITDILETVIICMLLFLLVRAYIFDQAVVNGTSMEPTLYNTQRVLYNQLYSPKDYDIVIVKNEKLGPLVKRVIATEGEEVDIRDGYVYVNGVRLDEQLYVEGEKLEAKHFVTSQTTVSYMPFIEPENYPITVPDNCIFIMGDNRCVSNDSRSRDVGFVPVSDVIGKVIMRYNPLKEFKLFL